MPVTEEEIERCTLLFGLVMPVMNQFVQGLDKGKGMFFLFVKSESKTPGGLVARPVLTSLYRSKHFKDRYDPTTSMRAPSNHPLLEFL